MSACRERLLRRPTEGDRDRLKAVAREQVVFKRGVVGLSEAEADVHVGRNLRSLQFALQPVIDEKQVVADIVEAGAPRVRAGAMTRPLLVVFAVDLVVRELADRLAAHERQRRAEIHHIDLVVGIGRRNPQSEIRRPVVVALRGSGSRG